MIVLEIENSLKESSTAKWSFSSSSGGQSHPTQSLEHLRMLRKQLNMTIFWCNFKPMILLIMTIVILEGYITRACQIQNCFLIWSPHWWVLIALFLCLPLVCLLSFGCYLLVGYWSSLFVPPLPFEMGVCLAGFIINFSRFQF
jgi:hypothetical protein